MTETPSTDASRPGPLPPAARISELDAVRGVAILGILPVNILAFKASMYVPAVGLPLASALDRAARWVTFLLFQQKFYTLFAFLFGLGLAIQGDRAEARGQDPGPPWRRRLTALAGIGAVHAFGIWWGDILLTYSLLGFGVVLFRRARVRAIAWSAFGIGASTWVLQIAILALVGSLAAAFPEVRSTIDTAIAPMRADMLDHVRRSIEVYGSGTFGAIAAQRAADVGRLYSMAVPTFPYIVGLMLAGFACGKAGLHRRIADARPGLRRALPWLAAVGVAGNLAYAAHMISSDPSAPTLAAAGALAAGAVGIPALSAAYAAAVVLAWGTTRGRRALAPLAAVGRTALSCYLLQSVVATTLFYGYGFGLYGKVGPAAAWWIVIGIWAVLPPLAVAWLRRFRFGPAEWVWRALTYRERPPFRR